MSFEIDVTMDACGLYCPEPVMMLHNQVRDMAGGAVLEVIATDPSTERDVPKFCNFLGHELLSSKAENGKYFYYIRKTA
ncbi:tRNA 2-thiouridine synthesizing protein A [Sinobacterium caligoides]|uniref:Sulfur carrier protein TusA n=1 Tax=Sinobacterium caligoides TaxID=933926 RepID=A0A3N2DMF0_9GAMM|nr:sulfurtransferase TusA [Sinobacterium caligoides]ROS00987.1 tRNA 2-thiouridine synthesizing protein A [Sinobacterium caligoides]